MAMVRYVASSSTGTPPSTFLVMSVSTIADFEATHETRWHRDLTEHYCPLIALSDLTDMFLFRTNHHQGAGNRDAIARPEP